MKITNPLAKKGEDLATDYLKKHGYKIIERNFHIRGGEIDIIAMDTSDGEETLVFVEVKTRSSVLYGTPFEAITPWKLKALIKTGEFYTVKHPQLPKQLRIDAVSVLIENEKISIELIKNISL